MCVCVSKNLEKPRDIPYHDKDNDKPTPRNETVRSPNHRSRFSQTLHHFGQKCKASATKNHANRTELNFMSSLLLLLLVVVFLCGFHFSIKAFCSHLKYKIHPVVGMYVEPRQMNQPRRSRSVIIARCPSQISARQKCVRGWCVFSSINYVARLSLNAN